jgi:hypothetical protein
LKRKPDWFTLDIQEEIRKHQLQLQSLQQDVATSSSQLFHPNVRSVFKTCKFPVDELKSIAQAEASHFRELRLQQQQEEFEFRNIHSRMEVISPALSLLGVVFLIQSDTGRNSPATASFAKFASGCIGFHISACVSSCVVFYMNINASILTVLRRLKRCIFENSASSNNTKSLRFGTLTLK